MLTILGKIIILMIKIIIEVFITVVSGIIVATYTAILTYLLNKRDDDKK